MGIRFIPPGKPDYKSGPRKEVDPQVTPVEVVHSASPVKVETPAAPVEPVAVQPSVPEAVAENTVVAEAEPVVSKPQAETFKKKK